MAIDHAYFSPISFDVDPRQIVNSENSPPSTELNLSTLKGLEQTATSIMKDVLAEFDLDVYGFTTDKIVNLKKISLVTKFVGNMVTKRSETEGRRMRHAT